MSVDALIDLARGKPALQSSRCEWSIGSNVLEDAAIPVSPNSGTAAYCHTGLELEPWWQVDVGTDSRIDEIRILNRVDEPQRLRRFAVLVSSGTMDGKWVEVFRKSDDVPLSASEPFVIQPAGPCVARLVRLQLLGEGYLHIRQCQVIGEPLKPSHVGRLTKKMLQWHEQATDRSEKLTADLHSGRRGQVTEIGPYKVFVDTDRYSPKLVHALCSGGYEWRERQLIPALIKPGDRVLEVGTAIGVVTMSAASIVGAAAVVTYDANPDIVADAKRNFAANSFGAISANVGVMRNRAAWREEETEVDFYVSRDFWASRLDPGPTTADIDRVVKVPLVRLEDAIERHRANVLICDIEGGEGDLLIGADLTSIRAILMETHYWSIGRRRTDDMIRYLVTNGFDINLDVVGDHVIVLERP